MHIRPYFPSDWPRLCTIHDAARLDELRLSVGEAAFLTLEGNERFAAAGYLLIRGLQTDSLQPLA